MPVDITELTNLHNAFEKRLKEYQQATNEFPPIEVLNEIRYAFRAALELCAAKEGLTPREGDSSEDELIVRILHALKCGYHDLVDGLAISIPKIIDELRRSFPESTYDVIGKEMIQINIDVRQVEALVANSRGNPAERRSIYVKVYDEWFAKLLKHLQFLKESGLVIAQREKEKDKAEKERRKAEQRRQWINVAIGVVIMIVGVVLGYYIQ